MNTLFSVAFHLFSLVEFSNLKWKVTSSNKEHYNNIIEIEKKCILEII